MSPDTLQRLKRQAKRLKITHDRIAAEAGVGRTLVVHVLAGRAKSANVVSTIKRLIAGASSTPDLGSLRRNGTAQAASEGAEALIRR